MQNEFNSFVWSNSYGVAKKIERMKSYLDNLVSICNDAPKCKSIP